MRWLFLGLFLGSPSALAAPQVALQVVPELATAFEAALRQELPELVINPAADLLVTITPGYFLQLSGAPDPRPLGPDAEPALRRAVLIVVEHLSVRAQRGPDGPKTVASAETATAAPFFPDPIGVAEPVAPPKVVTATIAVPMIASPTFQLEASLGAGLWMSPLAPQAVFSVGVFRRWSAALLGVRGLVWGCCAAERDNLRVRPVWAAALAEAGWSSPLGPGVAEVRLGAGAGWAHISAQVVDLFVGDTKPETQDQAVGVGRASVGWTWSRHLGFAAGAYFVLPPQEVTLPAPYSENRQPAAQGLVSPFIEIVGQLDLF